jgi:predicted permease
MWSDLCYAARTLAKSPAFALTAVLALALGIGANTAIYSVINSVLLHPPGISQPDRMAAIRVNYGRLNLKSIGTSAPDYINVRDSARIFSAATLLQGGNFNYTAGGTPERLRGWQAAGRPFEVFGVKPVLGRAFTPEEDQPNASRVVILTHALWQRDFGGDPGIIGKAIELNQQPYKVIGVTGPDFRWPLEGEFCVPFGLPPETFDPARNRHNQSYNTFARLRPDVTFAQAEAYVKLMTEQIIQREDQGGYAKDSGWGLFATPYIEFTAGNLKTPMIVLLGAVAFVLLIACSNIAGLLLARASSRGREIAVRAALGAGRWRLVRQLLAESSLLSLAGGLLGLALGSAGIKLLLLIAPAQQATGFSVHMDTRVLLFTAAVTLLSGILFGLAPAWQLSRTSHFEMLKEGGRSGTASLARQKLRSTLVAGEFALALVLLVGAGLFLRSLARLQNVQTGFQPRGVMSGVTAPPRARYQDDASRIAFYRAVVERLSAVPGVQSAAAGIPLPFSGDGASSSFAIEGRQVLPGDPGPHGDIRAVSPAYFSTLGIPVLAGRVFTAQDRDGAEPVAVIDDTLAKQYWPNENPLGKRIRNGRTAPWATIVGMVGHVRHTDLSGDSSKGVYYYPVYQRAAPYMAFLARTAGDPRRLAGAMRDAVRAVDPSQPIFDLKSMDQRVAESLGARRFAVTLLGVFAALAMLLAAIGIYGVISYAVTQRTQEIGIRMALGAERRAVLGMILRQAMKLAAAGVLGGVVVAALLARLVSSQLFHVSEFDPLTFSVMALVLALVALAASFLPAWRATRVDPMVALRYE